MTAFDQAFSLVVGFEGGYCDEHADPGNWTGGAVGCGILRGTKFGISAAAYPALDIAALTAKDAAAIYRRDYWAVVGGDDLPPPLALLVFDAAVNNGVGRATRWLQQAVDATVDGRIGPETLACIRRAVAAQGVQAIGSEFLARRLVFMAGLATWRTFGLGWARRLCALPFLSLTISAGD